MKHDFRQALAAMPARQLNLVALGAVAIVAALLWTFAIRAPLAAMRQQQVQLAALNATRAAAPLPLSPGAAPAGAAVAPPAAPPAAPAPLALIAAVSASARDAGLAVGSARPGAQRNVAGLHQQTLDIDASGGYGAILDWVADIEARHPAVGFTRLSLRAAPDEPRRLVQLQLAAYGDEAKR
jgi:type II secretory pathway component PulM